jgi:hypothetical protein
VGIDVALKAVAVDIRLLDLKRLLLRMALVVVVMVLHLWNGLHSRSRLIIRIQFSLCIWCEDVSNS